MDRIRFETLSRTLARAHSRRGALRLAAAALVGVGAEATLGAAARHKHKRCKPPTKQRCDGTQCVNLLTDLANCGSCGNVCGDAGQCRNGMCCGPGRHPIWLCGPTGSACNAHTCCQNGACVNGLCP